MALTIFSEIFFILFSVVISEFDIETGAVPRLFFILAFPVFFLLILINREYPVLESMAGMTAGLGVFFLAWLVSGKKLGLADVWYSAFIGLVMGPLFWYRAVMWACIAGIVYFTFSEKQKIPFIPYMASGCFFNMIFGGL